MPPQAAAKKAEPKPPVTEPETPFDPDTFDWEGQDDRRFKRPPPVVASMHGYRVLIEDLADTGTLSKALGDPSSENIRDVLEKHVLRPRNFNKVIEGWGSAALMAAFKTVQEALGINDDFFSGIVVDSSKDRKESNN